MSHHKHPTGSHAYDTLPALAAVLAAWNAPADQADYDVFTRERVREVSLQLGRALDRLELEGVSPASPAGVKMLGDPSA